MSYRRARDGSRTSRGHTVRSPARSFGLAAAAVLVVRIGVGAWMLDPRSGSTHAGRWRPSTICGDALRSAATERTRARSTTAAGPIDLADAEWLRARDATTSRCAAVMAATCDRIGRCQRSRISSRDSPATSICGRRRAGRLNSRFDELGKIGSLPGPNPIASQPTCHCEHATLFVVLN